MINYLGRALYAFTLCVGVMMTGCCNHKDLDNRLNDHESRLNELERLTSQQNTNIESIQTIVNAIQERDYIKNIAPIKEGANVIGHTITVAGVSEIDNSEIEFGMALSIL